MKQTWSPSAGDVRVSAFCCWYKVTSNKFQYQLKLWIMMAAYKRKTENGTTNSIHNTITTITTTTATMKCAAVVLRARQHCATKCNTIPIIKWIWNFSIKFSKNCKQVIKLFFRQLMRITTKLFSFLHIQTARTTTIRIAFSLIFYFNRMKWIELEFFFFFQSFLLIKLIIPFCSEKYKLTHAEEFILQQFETTWWMWKWAKYTRFNEKNKRF